MNKNHYFKYFSLLLLMIFTYSSCKDKCKDVFCENGYCIKGDCFCEDGYSGDNCEIKESDRFSGKYNGFLKFPDITQVQNVDVKIKNSFSSPFDIKINIDSRNEVKLFYIKAQVHGDSIIVEQSFNEFINDYDTIINLIYPSIGLLSNDTLIKLPIVYRNTDYTTTYTVNLTAIKQD